MKSLLRRLWVEDEGQTMVEYALVVALIAIMSIIAVTYFGGKVSANYNTSANRL